MRLISCHVENYGKLSDFTYNFNNGINEIFESNGWGKTTFASFLKVMFFGFDNEGTRDEVKNERRRYKPWQDGVYGGSIEFEVRGKKYKLSRIFAAKDKDDTFELRDANTLIESNDFTANIGEELFGIDRDSFARTIYIKDNDCGTFVSGSINAKIGNLVDNTDDINNFEKVDLRLKDIINQNSPKLKRGSLKQLSEEINALKIAVKDGDSIDNSVAVIIESNNKDKEEQLKLREEQSTINKQLENASKYKDKKAKKEIYEKLVKEYEIRNANYTEVNKQFPGEIPAKEELDSMIAKSSKLSELSGRVKSLEITEGANEGDEANLKRLDELELKFASGIPSNETISELMGEWGNCAAVVNGLSSKKTACKLLEDKENEKYENKRRHLKTKASVFGIMALIFIIAGIATTVLGVTKSENLFICIAGAVLIAGIVFLVLSIKNKGQAKKLVMEDSEELLILMDEIANDEAYIKDTSLDMEDFFIRYNMPFAENQVNQELYNLRHTIDEYYGLKEKCEVSKKTANEKVARYEAAKKEYESKVQEITQYIKNLSFIPKEDKNSQLIDIKERLGIYEAAKLEYERALGAKQQFEKENPDYEGYEHIEEASDISLEELELKRQEIAERLEQLHKNISSYAYQIDELLRKREEISEKENELVRKEEQYAEGLVYYNDIVLVKELLNEAKVNLTNKYTKPIQDGINKYYRKVTGDNSSFVVDGNMNLLADEKGLMRNSALLSHGYQDLAGICMRMALIDAMYEDEKPFIIFDDPFVNLDDDKVAGGKKLLEDIANEYQIVHFTCHKSRRGIN